MNLNEIVYFFDDFLKQYGYSSRLIDKFLNSSKDGDLFHFSDRSQIINSMIPNIKLFGQGVYGDRVLNNGSYSHNFFIEMFVQYGILFSIAILFVFARYIIRTTCLIFKENNRFMQSIVFAFLAIFFGKMMFSSSYLIDSSFWLFLSMISLIQNKHCIKADNKYEKAT